MRRQCLQTGWGALKAGLGKSVTPGRVMGAAELALVADAATATDIVALLLHKAAEEGEESMTFDVLWTALPPLLELPGLELSPEEQAQLPDWVQLVRSPAGVDDILGRVRDRSVPAHTKRDAFHQLGLWIRRNPKESQRRAKALLSILPLLDAAVAQGDIVTIANGLPALNAAHEAAQEAANPGLPPDYAHLDERSLLRPLVGLLRPGELRSEAALRVLAGSAARLPPLDWDALLSPLLAAFTPLGLRATVGVAVREAVPRLLEALLKLSILPL